MTSKYLNLDPSAAAACLSPKELAEQSQGCHIYSPALSKYVSVTTSCPVMKEQDSNFVETESDIRGHGKQFKLKLSDAGTFNIVTLDEEGEENGFLYLSEKVHSGVLHRSANILKSNDIIKGKECQYLFEAKESESQCGLYKIFCCGKTLFASKGTNKYLLAGDKDVENSDDAWFQFNLKTRVVNAELTGNEKCHGLTLKDSIEQSYVYDNDSSEDVNVKFSRKDKKFINAKELPAGEGAESSADQKCDDLFPTDPISVTANTKLTIYFTSELRTYTKLKEAKIDTENGGKFSGFKEQKCFQNRRIWKFSV